MNDKAGRLVQYNQIGVFVEDREGNGLSLAGGGLGRGDLRPDHVSAFCKIPGFLRAAVNGNLARPNQSADIGAG
jgi:hypothetical protein